MTIFDSMSTYGYGEAHLVRDEHAGLRAVVAIHDSRRGPALGGCRFVSYMNEGAAITDALRLARAMTYKAALAGLPHGGGKSVILAPSGEFDRTALLTRFAAFIEDLGGRYITAEDAGTSVADMELMRKRTKHVVGLPAPQGSGDPSPFTALGVRRGIEACVKFALGRDNLHGVHVAVQGVGNVGYHLCKELAEAGAKLTCADVRDELAQRVAKELGAQLANASEIHRVKCDVYAPCALGGAINDRTLPQLQCQIVAGAANNQLASDECGTILHERGILYAPDYAINAGGLINVAQEVAGYDPKVARARTLDIFGTVMEISERSRRANLPPHQVADQWVHEILAE